MSDPAAAILSSKGQLVLPKALRDRRGWRAGTRLVVEERPEGLLLRAAPAFPETDLADVAGSLAHGGPALSVEEMDAAIAAAARRDAGD
jgi:AbrB family looped-hinge helix DNA binding protein